MVPIDSAGDKPEGKGTPKKEGEVSVAGNKQKNGLTTKRGLSREEKNGGVQKTPDSGKKGVRIVEPESKPTNK